MKDVPMIQYIGNEKIYYLHKVDSKTQQCWWTQDVFNTVVDNLLDNDYQSFKDWTYYDWEFWLDHIRQALIVQGRVDPDYINIDVRTKVA